MLHRLLNLLTALSLLLSVAVCVLWVRSDSAANSIAVRHDGGQANVYSVRGSCAFSYSRFSERADFVYWEADQIPKALDWAVIPVPSYTESIGQGLVRFEVGQSSGFDGDHWFCWLPHWAIVCLSAMVPAFRLVRHHRRRRSVARGFPVDAATPTA